MCENSAPTAGGASLRFVRRVRIYCRNGLIVRRAVPLGLRIGATEDPKLSQLYHG